jgi:hypothetical protein
MLQRTGKIRRLPEKLSHPFRKPAHLPQKMPQWTGKPNRLPEKMQRKTGKIAEEFGRL